MKKKKEKQTKNSTQIKAFISYAFLALVVLFAVLHKLKVINMGEVFRFIDSAGHFGWIIFIFVYVISVLLLFPSSVLDITSGYLFGHVVGFIVVYVSTLMTATIGFFISRYVFHDYFHHKFADSSLLKWSNKLSERKLVLITCILRFVHIIHFGVLNYVLGLTKIKPWKYFIITAVFMIPELFVYVFIGSSLKNILSFKFILTIAVLAIGAIAVYLFRRNIRKILHDLGIRSDKINIIE